MAIRAKWVAAYGWLYALTAGYLLIAAMVRISGGSAAMPAASPFGPPKPISVLAALFQAALFGTAGWAILKRKSKLAVKLVWATIILSGLGVLFRGLVPLDAMVWLASLGLAIWYSKNAGPVAVATESVRKVEGGIPPKLTGISQAARTQTGIAGSPISEGNSSSEKTNARPTAIESNPLAAAPVAPALDGVGSNALAPTPAAPGKRFRISAWHVILVVAVGLGLVLLGSAMRYKYLKEGNIQFRVDRWAGRTDRLYASKGWVPIGFDRAPEGVNGLDFMMAVKLTGGKWDSGDSNMGEICFEVENNSDYILQSIQVRILVKPKPPDEDSLGDAVMLRQYGGGLLDRKRQGLFCGSAPRVFPTGATWSYDFSSAIGWKE